MCVDPLFIPKRKDGSYGFGEKSREYGSYVDPRSPEDKPIIRHGVLGLWVPCGKCPECIAARQRAWYARFWLEDKYWKTKGLYRTLFVTMTYSSDNLPSSRDEAFNDVRAFIKSVSRNIVEKPRYYLTSENGSTTGRLHYHMLLFGFPLHVGLEKVTESVRKCWHRGFVYVKYCSNKDFNYVSKYVTKDTDPYKNVHSWKTIQSSSKRPPLGLREAISSAFSDYFNRDIDNVLRIDGYSYALPRYLKSKVYSDDNKDAVRERFVETNGLPPLVTKNDFTHRDDVYETYRLRCSHYNMKKVKRIKVYENLSNKNSASQHGVEMDTSQ